MYMEPLHRLLKPKRLGKMLQEAAELSPQDCTLAVYTNEKLLAFAGEDVPSHTPDTWQANTLLFPLKLQGARLGTLALIPATDISRTTFEPLGRLISNTLHELLQSEHARRCVAAETLDKYRELELLHNATTSLNSSLRLKEVCASLLTEVSRAVPAAEMGMIFSKGNEFSDSYELRSFGPTDRCGFSSLRNSRLLDDITTRNRGEILNDLESDPRWDNSVPAVKSLLLVPLAAPNLQVGTLALGSSCTAAFQAPHLKRVTILSSIAATAMGNAHHFEEVRHLMDALLQALAEAIDTRDPMTAGHSQRVACLSVALAGKINKDEQFFAGVHFGEKELHEIFYAGLLHDIGKIGVKEQVLTKVTRLPENHLDVIGMRLSLAGRERRMDWKQDLRRLEEINRSSRLSDRDVAFIHRLNELYFPINGASGTLLTSREMHALLIPEGNLTPEERKEIERHPQESYRILQHIPFTDDFSNLLTFIHQHHERLDGSGYPAGIKGDEILLQSRILAVTDVYDAVTQERHYKPALPQERALEILRSEARRCKLDERLVTLFCNNIRSIETEATAINSFGETRPPKRQDALFENILDSLSASRGVQ
jgi:HD-GYP domain-containing protein (c-di-GMP phosphodiesterase class II)